ncbi:MAG TPA: signal peptide peptidase SppA [Acetobacteraceae bacterium]|nr:signal peptide peptidase SppA [Acetobacteraceae bacterium]
MSLDTDLLVERRRLKRRLSLWRAVAVIAGLAAVAAVVGLASPSASLPGRSHVARLTLQGTITEERRVLEAIERAGRDEGVRALIVAIDSGGGSVAGGEALHTAIRRVAERKPVVAVMAGTGASAAYMAALPAHRILARESTLTGSIGVLLQTMEVSELIARLGIRAEVLVSGPLKNQPGLFHPLSDEGRAALAQVIADIHGQFVARVAAGRRMEEARARELANGRVYTGREAVGLGLIDAIGGEPEARAWLAAERGVPEETPVRDLEVRSAAERLFARGLSTLIRTVVSEWLIVDAPVSVWQPLR